MVEAELGRMLYRRFVSCDDLRSLTVGHAFLLHRYTGHSWPHTARGEL